MQTTNKYPAALPGWIEATPIQPETGCVSRPANRLRAPLAAPNGAIYWALVVQDTVIVESALNLGQYLVVGRLKVESPRAEVESSDQARHEVGPAPRNVPGALGRRSLGDRRRPIGRDLGLEAPPIRFKPAGPRTMTLPLDGRGELAPASRTDQRGPSPASPFPLAASARTVRPVEQGALMTASKAPNRHRRPPVSIRLRG